MGNKLTVYQSLLNKLSGNGRNNTQTFNGDGGLLLKAQSKEELNTQILQAQQDKYLKSQWDVVQSDKVQKAMQYEITRFGSYTDFEAMEFFPEIASALDIYAEEATTAENGTILNIYSESNRIKNILEDLFHDKLKINVVLHMIVRNLCKYGDNFMLLNLDSKKGVTDFKQLPNYEIERIEGDILHNYRKSGETSPKTKFVWRQNNMEFNEFQVAHFRLFGDDRKLPYGTSILEKCRRIYKQLLLAEDAMLTYRVTRAPERRVFKIYVGNIDEADIPAYVNNIANMFKRAPIYDPKTGNIDNRLNQASHDQDFFIPVRDENSPSPIETLPGAQNLDAIADIEYLQNKLCVALRIPKTFLGFGESVGEGKNLSLMDVRFARNVNRIQQAVIQELNKIAIIHLYLLGFDDDLKSFKLTLNNPSSASKMLLIEELDKKIKVFKDLVSDAGDGLKTMSRTEAMKLVFDWSEQKIMDDLLKMRIEKVVEEEYKATTQIIKHSGVFDKVDRIYGDLDLAKSGKGIASEGGDESDGGLGGSSGGFGGGGFDDSDFGDIDGGDEGADGEDFELDDDISSELDDAGGGDEDI